jgi:hypothetical protein
MMEKAAGAVAAEMDQTLQPLMKRNPGKGKTITNDATMAVAVVVVEVMAAEAAAMVAEGVETAVAVETETVGTHVKNPSIAMLVTIPPRRSKRRKSMR